MKGIATVLLIALPLAGCATAGGPRRVDVSAYEAATWSRVGELARGATIVMRTERSDLLVRSFVTADDSSLTLLNLNHAVIPAAAKRTLRNMAAAHPEHFAAIQTAGALAQDSVRIGHDGLFVSDRKIADLDQIVEIVGRDAVSEIYGPVRASGSVGGAILGGYLGFALGVVPGLGGVSPAAAWAFLVAATAAGGSLGFHWSHHSATGLVYRSP